MAYQPFKLSKRETERLKTMIEDLDAIKADLERAEQAGVPNIAPIVEVCNHQLEDCARLRSVYSPGVK